MAVVAVLGTGRMGSAMARSLARKGHELVLWNRTEVAARALGAQIGARVASDPRSAVADADVGISMLADRSAVEAVYGGPSGVLEGVHQGVVLLDMSTVEPDVSQGLAPGVEARGGWLLDAPVSGSVSLAEQGRLTVMVGGDTSALRRAQPVLDALAARVFHLGPTGAGAAMKLAVNAVIFGLNVALSEALVLAERAGVAREAAYDVLEASAVGAPYVTYKREAFLHPESVPTAFSLDLAAKDLRLITDLARATGVPVAQAMTNLALISEAAASQGGDRDFALVASHLRRDD